MAHVYNPNPLLAPVAFTLPDDGDMKSAAVPNAAWAALMDSVANLRFSPVFQGGLMTILEDVLFSNTSTFTSNGGFWEMTNGSMTCESDFPITIKGHVDHNNGSVCEFKSGSTCQFDVGANLLLGGTTQTVGTVTCTFYNVHVPNNLTVDGVTDLNGLVTIDGALDVIDVTAAGTITFSGGGHARWRVDPGANGTRTFAIASGGTNHECDCVHFTGALTGDQNWTFKNELAGDGDMIEISLLGSTGDHFVNIKRDDGTTLVAMANPGSSALNPIYYVKLRHNGTNWIVFNQVRNP